MSYGIDTDNDFEYDQYLKHSRYELDNDKNVIVLKTNEYYSIDLFNEQLTNVVCDIPENARYFGGGSNRFTNINWKFPSCLTTIDLTSNQIINFTAVLPQTLIDLQLSYNRLSSLPDLYGLLNLQRLFIDHNQFTQLPRGVETLTSLELLWCDENKLTSLPDLSALQSLESLICCNNQITTSPDLLSLSRLKKLWIHNNRLKKPPLISSSVYAYDDSNNNYPETPQYTLSYYITTFLVKK